MSSFRAHEDTGERKLGGSAISTTSGGLPTRSPNTAGALARARLCIAPGKSAVGLGATGPLDAARPATRYAVLARPTSAS